MKKLILSFIAVSLAVVSCSPNGVTGPTPPPGTPIAPDSFLVVMTTSKGEVVMKAHRDWSPAAVDRFYELTKGDVWSDARIFRMVPGFVAQWGITGDSAKDHLWQNRPVIDEPVRVPNLRGRVSFARGGPQTRTLQVFINLSDNSSQLDNAVSGGVRGYPPIAEVIQGMAIVDAFESKYRDQPTPYQEQMSNMGWDWLDPKCVSQEWR
jgi:peptidyl-prolyl cis-trans isomerase A (cyclophilin A)